MTKRIGIYLVLLLLVTSACKKYEEGPFLSLRSKEKRLCQKWELKNASFSGDDIEIMDEFSHYYWDIKKEGTIECDILFNDWGDEEHISYDWEWIDKKNSIRLTERSNSQKNTHFLPFPFFNEKSSSSEEESIECDIMRLTFDEFILEYEEDGEIGRLEFEKK